MSATDKDEVRNAVRKSYAEAAKAGPSGCCSGPRPCCSSSAPPSANEITARLGYSEEDLATVPEGANLGLGCGNPQAIAGLEPGEVVLDLGSGGGFDCFLASRRVGEGGRVIGVDMTPEMVARARENASRGASRTSSSAWAISRHYRSRTRASTSSSRTAS